MNRRQALKGLGAAAAVAAIPTVASAETTRAPNPYGWPDRVKVGDTFAQRMRPYLDGKRVYGGVDACESEGWIRAIKRTPDNHAPDGQSERGYVLLRGRVEFRTVNADGSWPD